jgi:Zn-dependent peptidase ImmA (M78 family)
MLPDCTAPDCARALDQVVAEALAQLPHKVPPVCPVRLAAALGVAVALDGGQRARGRYLRRAGRGARARPAILVRPDPRPERLAWAVAHEIGEHLAHQVFARLGVDPETAPPQSRERVANQLAGRILVPTAALDRAGPRWNWDLPRLKSLFSTASHELIARRMLAAQVPVVITICDQGAITFRAGSLPSRPPPPAPLELACLQSAHRTAQPITRSLGPLMVQAWPIHEPHWQREILRTTSTLPHGDPPD